MNAVERIWIRARGRNGHLLGRRGPTTGIRAVLLALVKEPMYGCEIARRTGQDQGNVSRWLRRLEAFGFVDVHEVVGGVGGGERRIGHGGARPAVFWRLTRNGRDLVEALVAAERGAV